MSRSFRVASGGLLLATAAIILIIQSQGVKGDPNVIRIIAMIFAIPGCVLIAAGLKTPFAAKDRHLVGRKLTLKNLILGPVVIAVSAGVLYVCLFVVAFVPHVVALTAMAGILVGVFLTASVQGDACVRCDRLLDSARVHFADEPLDLWEQMEAGAGDQAIHDLGEPAPKGPFALWFHVCMQCRSVAICRSHENRVIVLTGTAAQRLAQLATHPDAVRGTMIFT
jgi:hypothetical protein